MWKSLEDCQSQNAFTSTLWSHLISNAMQLNDLEVKICLIRVLLSYSMFSEINFPGSGTGAGNGVAAESTGIMTEVEGKDSPRQDMTWVPSRNAWEETGEISSNADVHSVHLVSAVV